MDQRMAAIPYVDDLVGEYLLFRGFTTTWQSFSNEKASDFSCDFQARTRASCPPLARPLAGMRWQGSFKFSK